MKLPVPEQFFEASLRNYLIRLIKALTSSLDNKVDRNIPVDSVLLVSPNGSVYTVRVANDGTLSTEIVYDKS